MLRRLTCGLLGLFLAATVAVAADVEVSGTIVKIDPVKKTISVKTDAGVKEYTYDAALKVLDARGKELKDGIKDKGLTADAEVELLLPEKGKTTTVKSIQLLPPPAPKPPVTKGKTATVPPGQIAGKVTKLDVEKKTFSVTTTDGKKLDLTVTEATKFVGPRGGHSAEGIKDDRFVTGAEVKLVLDAAGKSATEVHLPYRSRAPKDDMKSTAKKGGS